MVPSVYSLLRTWQPGNEKLAGSTERLGVRHAVVSHAQAKHRVVLWPGLGVKACWKLLPGELYGSLVEVYGRLHVSFGQLWLPF